MKEILAIQWNIKKKLRVALYVESSKDLSKKKKKQLINIVKFGDIKSTNKNQLMFYTTIWNYLKKIKKKNNPTYSNIKNNRILKNTFDKRSKRYIN